MSKMTTLLSFPIKKEVEREEMKSTYVHPHMSVHEDMHRRFNSYDNRMHMRSFDMERISDILDALGHPVFHR